MPACRLKKELGDAKVDLLKAISEAVGRQLTSEQLEQIKTLTATQIKQEIKAELTQELKAAIKAEILQEIQKGK